MILGAGLAGLLVVGFLIGWLFGSAARLGGPDEAGPDRRAVRDRAA